MVPPWDLQHPALADTGSCKGQTQLLQQTFGPDSGPWDADLRRGAAATATCRMQFATYTFCICSVKHRRQAATRCSSLPRPSDAVPGLSGTDLIVAVGASLAAHADLCYPKRILGRACELILTPDLCPLGVLTLVLCIWPPCATIRSALRAVCNILLLREPAPWPEQIKGVDPLAPPRSSLRFRLQPTA